MKKIFLGWCVLFCLGAFGQSRPLPLKISADQHYFVTGDQKPFFWLGDTGWLLFTKCDRDETLFYLNTRERQGFNVIQVMVLHSLDAKNVYGHKALIDDDISKPDTTPGRLVGNNDEYDYWDHIDFVVDEAAKRNMYVAMVPVWGSAAKSKNISIDQIRSYGKFLAGRYKNKPNIIWLNGGDIPGNEKEDLWIALGEELKKDDPAHLITFHPRGRYSSTDWFHNEPWLDFNMFQSGHRNYLQDTSAAEKHRYGEDNWRYVQHDWNLKPAKPVLDGEPSYEHIPQGLHDSSSPRWNDADVRRYAYWSVFAGAAGFTYGDNAVMQFYTKGNGGGAFGVRENWKEDINAPGARQMHHLKGLMLSFPYPERVPAQEIIVDNDEGRYNYLLATRGPGYAMVYTYTGRDFKINISRLDFEPKNFFWFRPATGKRKRIKKIKIKDMVSFNPPGNPADGNDWVLIIEK